MSWLIANSTNIAEPLTKWYCSDDLHKQARILTAMQQQRLRPAKSVPSSKGTTWTLSPFRLTILYRCKLSLHIPVLHCGHSPNVLLNPYAQKEKMEISEKSQKGGKKPQTPTLKSPYYCAGSKTERKPQAHLTCFKENFFLY